MTYLLQHLVFEAARRAPADEALVHGASRLDYAALAAGVQRTAAALLRAGLGRRERVAVYLDKSVENVFAMFGAAAAGGVFVPVNPLLKPEQLGYILDDCQVSVLVTSAERLPALRRILPACPALRLVVATGAAAIVDTYANMFADQDCQAPAGPPIERWDAFLQTSTPLQTAPAPGVDGDMAAILYTSGSTGKPKGVILSHRNLLAGAHSVASYLDNRADDRILAVLPLSFDYGLSQLTTAFHAGASVVLLNYLFPRDILRAVRAEAITGLAAVPPLWRQLVQLDWPDDCSLRYLTNSGGAMPRATLDALRRALPRASPFLMYGLTEAFRSTYLPPEELARRPDSIGRAIPNAEILVLRPDGSACGPDEPGELVHRGAQVALGYWNDVVRTAQRFRPLVAADGLPLPEMAVWSGDTVRRDAQGFLYFIGRGDDMIKTSAYRVSPEEVEEVAHACAPVAEAAAVGVPHPQLGQAIVLVACLREGAPLQPAELLAACKPHLPAYMLPAKVVIWSGSLPRNPNGKIDRRLLGQLFATTFDEPAPAPAAAAPIGTTVGTTIGTSTAPPDVRP